MIRPTLASLLLVSLVMLGRLTVDLTRTPRRQQRLTASFQRAVGGLGLGASQTLSPCPAAFDERLAAKCLADCGRLPAGSLFCVGHSGLVEAGIHATTPENHARPRSTR